MTKNNKFYVLIVLIFLSNLMFGDINISDNEILDILNKSVQWLMYGTDAEKDTALFSFSKIENVTQVDSMSYGLELDQEESNEFYNYIKQVRP